MGIIAFGDVQPLATYFGDFVYATISGVASNIFF
jgi:hypothetical protein